MFGLKMPKLGPVEKPLRIFRRQLPPLNFITIHYIYFIATCLLFAVIFWGSSTPARSISFTDSLFFAVSAMTLAGLNTINLSELNTFQQFLLFLLIMLGSAIFVSAFVVHVRKNAFENKFKDVIETRRQRKAARGRSTSRRRSFSLSRKSTRPSDKDAEVKDVEKDAQASSDTSAQDKEEPDRDGAQLAQEHSQDRDHTPPSRRGAPEMNGKSSKTGERTNSGFASDSESEYPGSPDRNSNPGVTFSAETRFHTAHDGAHTIHPARRRNTNLSFLNMQGVGARPATSLQPMSPISAYPTFSRSDTAASHKGYGDISQYFDTVGGWISRNSQFHGLSEKEREKLGGCEYRAVSFLAWLVPAYFVMWQLLGCIGCAAWVAVNRPDTARSNGLNPWWVGAFNAVSAFNNSGMSLLDANMTAFQTSYYMLLTMSLLILAGNTCFPIFLRAIVWTMWWLIRRFEGEAWAERTRTLRFLLDHPRRCYTNMFPSQHTYWLLASVIMLNGVDWAAFEILNIGNDALENSLEVKWRAIDGLFQAFAVRSGGFYVVAIPTVRISLQVLYVVMMYISVYPVVITMRNSNVYEERSLGIYADETSDDTDEDTKKETETGRSDGFLLRRAKTIRDHFVGPAPSKESNGHFVRQQLRAQLAHDAWWIVLALFLIMIVEGSNFERNPGVWSVFNFIFEIVSAYGCVGISVGVPWAAYSFCGSWRTLSKLILCAVMIRGRHRGLPVAIDKAVLLPGEETSQAEEDDAKIRLARSYTRGRDGMQV